MDRKKVLTSPKNLVCIFDSLFNVEHLEEDVWLFESQRKFYYEASIDKLFNFYLFRVIALDRTVFISAVEGLYVWVSCQDSRSLLL